MSEYRACLIVISLVSCCAVAAALAEDADIDRFILPETPPTIERQRNQPLDQPQVRKQNYIGETDIPLPSVLLNIPFPSLGADIHPVALGLFSGSFGRRGGFFRMAAPQVIDAGYRYDRADGENASLGYEKSSLAAVVSLPAEAPVDLFGVFSADDTTLDTDVKRMYRADCSARWYPLRSLKSEISAGYAYGELTGRSHNDAVSGDLGLTWQPFEGLMLNGRYQQLRDSAFASGNDFITTEARCSYLFGSRFVLSAGGRAQEGTVYPSAGMRWLLLPRLRFEAAYEPGRSARDWNTLYGSDRHVIDNPGLLCEERPFALNESLVWDAGEAGSAAVTLRQATVKNMIYWDGTASGAYVTPYNADERYVSGAEIVLVRHGSMITPHCSAEWTNAADLPMIPEWSADAGVELAARGWKIGCGAAYVSRCTVTRPVSAELKEYTRMKASLGFSSRDGIGVTLVCGNILGQTIERQRGYAATAADFLVTVTAQF